MPNVWVEGARVPHEGHDSDGHKSLNNSDAVPRQVRVKRIDIEAPWRWLDAGWRDMTHMPAISLTYGALFAIAAIALFAALTNRSLQPVILPLAGGFLLIGPVAAVGLYEGSRRSAAGEEVSFGAIFMAVLRAPGQLALLGLGLMLIYLAWVQIALFMFMMYFGGRPFTSLEQFLPDLLLTNAGLTLLISGTLAGAILAAITFMVSAISAPLLAENRELDVATAVMASMRAARLNWPAMALWAALIAVIMTVGLMTLFAGLAVAFPLIGHATWHACRDITSE